MITIGIDPIAFTIGAISVRWYGIFVVLNILVIVLWMLREVRRGANLSYDTILTAALVGIPSGIIFSRLLHVVDRWDIFSHNPGQIIGFEGLTFYGAVLGAALAIWIYSKFSNFQFGYLADLVAPAIALGHAIGGRVGCTINGCCHGIEAPSWLLGAIVYSPIHSPPDGYQVSAHLLGVPLYPTQPYEIIYNLIVFALLLRLRGRFKPDGALFLVYLSLYSLWRVGIDFLREGTPFLFGLHQAQVVALIVLAITIPLLAYRTRWVEQVTDGNG